MIDKLEGLELRTEGPHAPEKVRRGVLQIKIPDDIHAEIREIAAINGIPISTVVSKLLTYGLEKMPPLPDLPEDGRFVGSSQKYSRMKRYLLEPGLLDRLLEVIKPGYSITYVAANAITRGLSIAKENSRKRQHMDSRPAAAQWHDLVSISDNER